jgi:hypothetical protein
VKQVYYQERGKET